MNFFIIFNRGGFQVDEILITKMALQRKYKVKIDFY